MSKNQKYTIANAQQDKLLNLGMDLKDAFVLSYLREIMYFEKTVTKKVGGKQFIWINYEKLLDYLPILKINTIDAIYRRFKRYEDKGLVIKHVHKFMNGSYTFFYLKDEFFDLFEISKIKSSDTEIKKQMMEMGLSTSRSDEKSGGFGRKVGSISDEKSALNTPKNNSSSTKENAATPIDFTKELERLLSKSCIDNINSNTVKNIFKFSNGSLTEVENAISFMRLQNKIISIEVLVAILRDGDYKKVKNITPKNIKRDDKIKFMLNILGESEVKRLRDNFLKEIGFECNAVDDQLGNYLCKRFNKYKQ